MQRRVAVLQDHSGVVDPDLGEVVGPGAQGMPVGNGEGEVVETPRWFPLSVAPRTLAFMVRWYDVWPGGEDDHEPGGAVAKGHVADVEVLDVGLEPEGEGVPRGAGAHVRHQELDMREAGDRRRCPRRGCHGPARYRRGSAPGVATPTSPFEP